MATSYKGSQFYRTSVIPGMQCCHLNKYVRWDVLTLENYSIFICNSNLTRHIIFAKFGKLTGVLLFAHSSLTWSQCEGGTC